MGDVLSYCESADASFTSFTRLFTVSGKGYVICMCQKYVTDARGTLTSAKVVVAQG